ncbi:hypothetical protein HYV81_02710 [Candidatus Woesearchaeota archaeon]|nr:hypothetical protein [Candidatus Woesearchaeota archaeon]
MNAIKRVFLIALIIMIVSLYPAFAASGFRVKAPEVIKDSILLNESAEFNITIQNTKGFSDTFRLSVPDSITWNVVTEPPSDKLSGILVEPYSSRATHVIVYPSKDIKPSRYGILLEIQSEYNRDVLQVPLEFNIRGGEFVPPLLKPDLRVDVELTSSGKFDPRKDATVTVFVKNKNQLTLQNINVSLKNSFIDKTQRIELLQPLERVPVEFKLSFNPKETPKAESLVITVIAGNKSFVAIKDVEIIGFEAAFVEDVQTTPSFLKSKTVVEVTNPGNSYQQERIKVESNILKNLFTSAKPAASTERENGQSYLVWELGLDSGATTQIIMITNYRPLLYLLILALIATIAYYMLRSPVVIDKGVREVHKKEGAIHQVKVILHVKNRSAAPVEQARVTDIIPTIAEYVKEEKAGQLEPTKVLQHERKGMLVTWEFDSLESHEERILTYSMRSKLPILGDMHLPKATVKFKDRKGRELVVRSNVHKLRN